MKTNQTKNSDCFYLDIRELSAENSNTNDLK